MAHWKNAKESLPPWDVPVLVTVGGSTARQEVSSYSFQNGDFVWVGLANEDVTHWAELPPFPTIPPDQGLDLPIKDQQWNAIFEHMTRKFDEEYASFCAWSMAYDIAEYGNGFQRGNPTYDDYRDAEEDSQKAYHLYRVCKDSATLARYAPYCWSLSSDLKKIAWNTCRAIPKKRGRGRPPSVRLRDELIRRIYSHYPKCEMGHKSAGSHFETLVGMILQWVEASPPDDIHAAIIRALRDF